MPDAGITFPHAPFSDIVRFTQSLAWMTFICPLVWGLKLKARGFRRELQQNADITGPKTSAWGLAGQPHKGHLPPAQNDS